MYTFNDGFNVAVFTEFFVKFSFNRGTSAGIDFRLVGRWRLIFGPHLRQFVVAVTFEITDMTSTAPLTFWARHKWKFGGASDDLLTCFNLGTIT